MIALIVTSATIYFYVVKHRNDKPRFITVIFVLLNCLWILLMVEIYFPENSGERGTPLYWLYVALVTLILALVSAIHWIFSIKYFESAISTSLFMGRDSLSLQEIESK